MTGIVLQPDVEDAHGDTVAPEVIEEAAHAFVAKYNAATKLGIQHKLFGLPDIHLAESYIAPEDTTIGGQQVLKGTWVMTVKVLNDEIWDGVKDGSLTGFSIGAIATVPAAEEAEVAKSVGEVVDVEKSRPLLALDVSEVSLVDAAANERKFLVTKALVQDKEEPPMAAKPAFTVALSVAKDIDKIKQLSKDLALERLASASSMIEVLKDEFESFTDIGQLWKAVDDIHSMLWPVEGNIATAVFKSLNEGDHALALADDLKAIIAKAISEVNAADAAASTAAIAKAGSDAVTMSAVEMFVAEQLDIIKAKSVTPNRLAELTALADGLSAAVAEMAPAEVPEAVEETEVEKSAFDLGAFEAMLDAKLEPLVKRVSALEPVEAEPTSEEQAVVAKALAEEELVKARGAEEAAKAETARIQKQLEELEAGSNDEPDAVDPDPADDVEQIQKTSLWKSVINQPTRKAKEAARRAAKTA